MRGRILWHSRLWNTWLGKTFAVLMLLLGCLPAAHAAFTIARTSSPTFYIDTAVSPQLTGMYASYQITSSTAVADVWVGIGGFTGAVVGPAANEDGDVHLGSFTAGQTKTAFFYLNASGATSVTQSHTVTVYDARPPFANALASAGFSFVGDSLGGPVQETIKASSNTVTTVVSGPNPPGLGGLVTITVTGKTGVIGAALRLAFTAAAFPNWPANKLEMIDSSITLSGGNSGTFTDTLLLTATSSTDTNYVATYIFRATGTTTAPTTISPVAYISGGTQIKHTDTSSYSSLAAIQPISNFVTLTKLVSAATLPQQGGTVTYTLRFTNSGSVDVALDSVVDTLPISPAAATYVAGSSRFNGVAIANPIASGQVRTWSALFSIPAGTTRDLTFQAVIPATVGSYVNSAYGTIESNIIDSTLSTSDNAPATATTRVYAAPSISKAFAPNVIAPGGSTSRLTFNIVNPNADIALTGVTFSDTLPTSPAPMTVAATPNAATSNCGTPTFAPTAAAGSVSFTGGTIPAGGTCTVSVDVVAALPGVYNNTSGTVSSTNGGTGNTASAALTVTTKPSISKAFSVPSIAAGGTATLTLTISNNSTLAISNVAFSDSFPAGLTVAAAPALTNTCGGTIVGGTAGANNVGLSGGNIAPNGSCTVRVAVTASVAGNYANTTSGVTSAETGSAGPASNTATLQVLAPPAISKAFSPNAISTGGTSTLTFTVTNPNSGQALNGVSFTDTFPVSPGAMVVAASPSATTSGCGTPTFAPAAGAGSISFSAGDIAAGSTCTVSVAVSATVAGTYNNVSGVVSSTNAGSGNSAAGTLTVNGRPSIAKSFSVATIPATTGTSPTFATMTLTITNNSAAAATGLAFSDTFPTGLVVAPTPSLANTCGGTVTGVTAGSGAMSLSGGSIASPGGTCSISFSVTSSTPAVYDNITGGVSSTAPGGGAGNPSNTATLIVLSPPQISKAFAPNPTAVNAPTTLTFSIVNSNNVALTGVAFTDTFPLTPGAMVVATSPRASTVNCGTPAWSPGAGSASVSFSGGTIPANSICNVNVDIKAPVAGTYNNVSGAVSATNGGTGNSAGATLTVSTAPSILKSFSPAAIPPGGTSTMALTISNGDTSAISSVAFSDSFPSGLVVATAPALTNSCGGIVSGATSGSTSVSLSGGGIAGSSSCTITLAVSATVAGSYSNVTGSVSSSGGTGATSNTAVLAVVAPPSIAKAFAVSSVPVNGTTTLTLTISNPSANTIALAGVAVTDNFPAGLQVAATPLLTNTCGGTVSGATSGSTSIALSGGAIPVNSACQVQLNVTPTTAGAKLNTTGSVTSSNAGTGNTASATLNVPLPPTIIKAFGTAAIGVGGVTTLTITLANPAGNALALSGVAVTDALPAGLQVASTPAFSNTCGGSVSPGQGAGDTSIALAGGSLAVGGSCQIQVQVTATTAGTKLNTTGAVTSTESGPGTTASATLMVLNALTVGKAFSPATIGVNGTSVLTITLTNGNSTAVTGAAFTDVYPSGLVNTTTPAGTTTCTSGTVTAANGGASAALSGGTVPASGSCTVTVNVTSATAGSYNNSTGPVTTTNAGTATAGTATLTVLAPPAISKVFSPTSISTGAVSTLTFTLTNSNATALTGTAFSDVYPAGLVNASTPNVNNTCGGSTTGGTPGANSVGLTGGTIPANGSCTVKVDVTSNTGGAYNNISGAVSSTNGGTGNTASATLSVLGKPSISKTFTPTSIVSGGSSTLTLTITNNGATPLTGVVFTDTFPAGLTIASTPALNNTCAGIISGGAAGNNFLDLTNGNVAANGFCSISVAVTASAVGTYNNTASGVSSNETGTPGASSNVAQLTVVGPPSIAKAFSPTVIGINGTSTLTFTLTNNNGVALTGVAFTDTYPANLVNAATPTVTSSCSGSSTGGSAGGNTIGLTGGSIPANSSCVVTVNVTSGTTGTYNNVSGTVTSTNGGTGNTASASLTVSANPTISKAFSPTTIPAGGVSTVTFVLSNSVGVSALTSSFTDNLPAGMVVASLPSATNSCLGTLNATAGNNVISLANGTIPGLGSCTITVNVTAAAAGAYPNTASAVSSSLGNGAPSNTATLTATAPATISKSFTPASILANGTSTLAFVINNPNSIALTGMAFTDNFPAGGLQVASAPNVTNNCGGTVNGATPGSTTVSLASGTLAAGASCTITLVVTSPIPGSFSNTTTGVSSNQTSTGAGANASLLTVVSPDLRLSKTHNGNFTIGVQGTYTLTIDNTLGTAATSGTITVTDTLPNGLTYVPAGSGGTGWTCSAAGQVVTCTSGTVIAAGTVSANPITINVSVAAIAVPSVTNSASVSGGGEPAANAGNNSAFDPTVVTAAAQNAFLTDGAQTALPGTTVFYTHRFNAGLSGTVAFSTSNVPDPAVGGWSNVIYRDANCNGILDGSEGNTALTGSIAVTPGDSICIIVKEFVPAGAPYNARDVITVTATFTPAAAPAVIYTHTDTTTVGNAAGAGLALQKTVRNVTTGGTAGTSNAARPGETLEYTITYTNNSADPLATIVVNDGTPAFTTFVSASCGAPLPANITACSVTTQPSVGSTGAISWTLTGSLASTQSGTVIFRVLLQ